MSTVKVSNAFTSQSVQVVAASNDGKQIAQTLSDGESILVGSDEQCRMRLPHASVSSKHCLVRFQNGEVTLQDWCSENGTHLNGEPIDGISIISPADSVQLGVYRLAFVPQQTSAGLRPATKEQTPKPKSTTPPRIPERGAPVSGRASTGSTPDAAPRSLAERADAASAAPGAEATFDAPAYATQAGPRSEGDLGSAGAPANDPRAALQGGLASAPPVEPTRDPLPRGASPIPPPAQTARQTGATSPAAPRTSKDSPSVEQSTIDLLKSEIELLQTELSEKDAQLRQLAAENKGAVDLDGQAANPDLEKRIEQLLFELDQSDQRVAALEEMSRLTEETQRAEAEEKSQLEAWVNDIEKRIAEREAESQAECDVLRQRLEKAAEERNHLNEQMDHLSRSDGTGDPALEEMVQTLRQEVQNLRQENEALAEQVAQRDAAYEQQKKKLAEIQQTTTGGGDEYIQQRVEETLRAERLLLAQERAALSRQQLELTNKVHELTHDMERQNRVHPADDRFRAFREQLKEIHEQEKTEHVAPTVSQRLARLWQRLDGPTDRD